MNDAYEPPGDRLVIPSMGIDQEIAYVTPPDGVATPQIETFQVTLSEPVAPAGTAIHIYVRRGDVERYWGSYGVSAYASGDDATLNLDLRPLRRRRDR